METSDYDPKFHTGMLFRDIDKEYAKQRSEFEQERSFRELHDRVREIVRVGSSKSDESIETERAGHVDQDTIHVTAADIKYGDAIKSGEDAVVKKTEWIPAGKRQVNGRGVNFSILFEAHDFTSYSEDGPKTRLGAVTMHAVYKDEDGIIVDSPLASFRIGDEGKAQVNYQGRYEMNYKSPDYEEIQKLISIAEQSLGLNQTINQSPASQPQ